MASSTSLPRWRELSKYSACDIADALLKLNVPGAGFLTDILPIPNPLSAAKAKPLKLLAPASTALMVPKSTASFPNPVPIAQNTPQSNLPPGDTTPYSDYTVPSTIVVISQPAGQSCAVVGGIMAARMKHCSAQGVVVDGRVRDLATLRDLGLPVWSKGTSIVGAGAETKFHAKEVPIQIGQVTIEPGDIIMIDEEENGVVAIPQGKIVDVLGMLPKLVSADEKVMEDVEAGVSVKEAFKKHRG